MFHVLNRAVARLTIFEKPEDYDAFLQVIDETWEIVPLKMYAVTPRGTPIGRKVEPCSGSTDFGVAGSFCRGSGDWKGDFLFLAGVCH